MYLSTFPFLFILIVSRLPDVTSMNLNQRLLTIHNLLQTQTTYLYSFDLTWKPSKLCLHWPLKYLCLTVLQRMENIQHAILCLKHILYNKGLWEKHPTLRWHVMTYKPEYSLFVSLTRHWQVQVYGINWTNSMLNKTVEFSPILRTFWVI